MTPSYHEPDLVAATFPRAAPVTTLRQRSNATGAKIADGVGIVTIVDDELCIFINDVYVSEGNAGAAEAGFMVSLSGAYVDYKSSSVQLSNASTNALSGNEWAAGSWYYYDHGYYDNGGGYDYYGWY